MIVIKNVEFYETQKDPIEIVSQSGPYEAIEVLSERGNCIVPVSEVREWIYGRRFQRPSDGVDVVLGLSKQAQDVLGLQYKAWENMSAELCHYHCANHAYQKKIENAQKATVWTRIKWVFSGYCP